MFSGGWKISKERVSLGKLKWFNTQEKLWGKVILGWVPTIYVLQTPIRLGLGILIGIGNEFDGNVTCRPSKHAVSVIMPKNSLRKKSHFKRCCQTFRPFVNVSYHDYWSLAGPLPQKWDDPSLLIIKVTDFLDGPLECHWIDEYLLFMHFWWESRYYTHILRILRDEILIHELLYIFLTTPTNSHAKVQFWMLEAKRNFFLGQKFHSYNSALLVKKISKRMVF